MSYTDIQQVLHPTLQYIIENFPNWTRYGKSQLHLDGYVEHTSWLYEYVNNDNTHKITIQQHKDTDSYDVEILGDNWISTYQGFSNFKHDRFAIVYVLKALLDMDKELSGLSEDQTETLEKIIDGHLNSENWKINNLYH